MKRIHLLKPGTFTDMSGQKVTLTAVDLAGCAAAYDPKLQEAPLVVGHPDDKAPAYGWAQSLSADDEGLHATPHQLDPGFVSLVQAGRFKTISASLYPPKHTSNPKPGSYYLRHIGFLGAQPPAVAGLKPVELAGDGKDCITIELSEAWDARTLADTLRSLRDWLIGKFGKDEADKALPSWSVDSLQASAAVEVEKERPASFAFASWSAERKPDASVVQRTWNLASSDELRTSILNFCKAHELVASLPDAAREWAFDHSIKLSEQDMTKEELAAQKAALDQQKTDQDARAATLVKQERDARRVATLAFVEQLVGQGRVHPREKNYLVELMAGLDASATLEFAEADGGTPAKINQLDRFKKFIGELPKVVNLGEHKTGNPLPDAEDPQAINLAAQAYMTEQGKVGRVLNIAQAITELKTRAA